MLRYICKIWKLTFRRDFDLFSDMVIFIEFYVITCIPSHVIGIEAISYQLSYFLTPERQCGKVVALQQDSVYKISNATF